MWFLFFAIRRASVRRRTVSHCRRSYTRSVYRSWLGRDRARGVVHAWSWLVENFSWWVYLRAFRRKMHVVACVRAAFRSAVAIANFRSFKERLCWTTWFPSRNRLYHKKRPPEDADLYPFAETKFSSDYWYTWVLVRRSRADDLTFLRCPMPRRRACEAERIAAFIMMYILFFTLYHVWNTNDVWFVWQLCAIENSWYCIMSRLFYGRILSADSFCYIYNFFVVTHVRPEEETLEKSDALLSDEEFVLHNSIF